jgi:hypothetical protein
VVALGFLVLIFLPQLALRTASGLQARQEDDPESPDDEAGGSVKDAPEDSRRGPMVTTPPAG